MLTHDVLKLFTALYVLTGIGILVEVARQLGVGFVKMREEYKATMLAQPNTSTTVAKRTIRPRHSRRNRRVHHRGSGAVPAT